MIKLIFVHGTGVREPRYTDLLKQIKKGLAKYKLDYEVLPCYWGEEYGSRLQANGASIPNYNSARATEDELEPEDYMVALWKQLYLDPLYELRTLALLPDGAGGFVPGQVSAGEELDNRVRNLKLTPEIEATLAEAEVAAWFDETHREIMNSEPYTEMLRGVLDGRNLDEYYQVVARASVAQLIARARQTAGFAPLVSDSELRDRLIRQLERAMNEKAREEGTEARGIVGEFIGKQVKGLAFEIISDIVQRQRGGVMDRVSPGAGDILLYQVRGQGIREFIKQQVAAAGDEVVLMGHSLGGIACVDLLVMENLPQVKYLITVGSQSPFFYEIGVLHSLAFGKHLPASFPRWLNIYDYRDFLSFVAKGVLNHPTGEAMIEDYAVNNHQPFPESHSAYFANSQFYKVLAAKIKA